MTFNLALNTCPVGGKDGSRYLQSVEYITKQFLVSFEMICKMNFFPCVPAASCSRELTPRSRRSCCWQHPLHLCSPDNRYLALCYGRDASIRTFGCWNKIQNLATEDKGNEPSHRVTWVSLVCCLCAFLEIQINLPSIHTYIPWKVPTDSHAGLLGLVGGNSWIRGTAAAVWGLSSECESVMRGTTSPLL